MKHKQKLRIDRPEFEKFISSYFREIIECIKLLNVSDIEKIIQATIEAYHENKSIYILGNGGAASTSSHFACDSGKATLRRTYDKKEKRLPVISLTDHE